GAGGGRTGEATGVVAGGVRGVAAAAAAREVGRVAEGVWGVAGEASSGDIAEEPSGRGGRLCPESVGGAPALHDGGLLGDRQQRGGTGLTCGRHRTKELSVFWGRRRRWDGRGTVHFPANLPGVGHRALAIPARCAEPAAGSPGAAAKRIASGRVGTGPVCCGRGGAPTDLAAPLSG